MQYHKIAHRFVSFAKAGGTQIRQTKAFDVAAARKMLRQGATLEAIGEAQGMTAQTVRKRLHALGLSFLIADPVRVGECRSKGQLARLAREKSGQ